MIITHFLFALFIAFVFSFFLAAAHRRRNPSALMGFLYFFMLLFFTIWAINVWVNTAEMHSRSIIWLPLLLVGLLVALLMCAMMPLLRKGDNVAQRTNAKKEATNQEEQRSVATLFGLFFWLLIIVAIAAIVAGYSVGEIIYVPAYAKSASPARQFDFTFEGEGKKFGTYLSTRYGANDIWLAYSDDGESYNDVFTGCAIRRQEWKDAYSAKYEEGKIVIEYRRAVDNGKKAREEHFEATLAEMKRDKDGDGLTDIVEKRLTTDLSKPDSDGDGTKDGADKNPLAASRDELSGEQKIWRAAFDQFYIDPEGDSFRGIVLIVFKSEKDFIEFSEKDDCVLLAMTEKQVGNFKKDIGHGVPCVYFDEITEKPAVGEKDRIDLEMHLYVLPLAARGYVLTLEKQEDGSWLLIEKKTKWIA